MTSLISSIQSNDPISNHLSDKKGCFFILEKYNNRYPERKKKLSFIVKCMHIFAYRIYIFINGTLVHMNICTNINEKTRTANRFSTKIRNKKNNYQYKPIKYSEIRINHPGDPNTQIHKYQVNCNHIM